MTLGEQIKNRREALHMTQEDLAEKIDVSRQAISKWEGDRAVPRGANREALIEILGLEIKNGETQKPQKLSAVGWIAAAALAVILLCVLFIKPSQHIQPTENDGKIESVKSDISRVRFYGENKEEIKAVALWYDVSGLDSILIDFSGGTPTEVKMLYTPAGTETMERTELLLTRSVSDENSVLLPADSLKREDIMGQVYFEVSFGGATTVKSEEFNVVFDPELGE